MDQLVIKSEGEALGKRFADLKRDKGIGRAKFARDNSIKGGDAMVYQHITGIRPMSLEAGLAYARGFGVPLEEISQRLAEESKKLIDLSEQETHLIQVARRLSAAGRRKLILEALEIEDAEALAAKRGQAQGEQSQA